MGNFFLNSSSAENERLLAGPCLMSFVAENVDCVVVWTIAIFIRFKATEHERVNLFFFVRTNDHREKLLEKDWRWRSFYLEKFNVVPMGVFYLNWIRLSKTCSNRTISSLFCRRYYYYYYQYFYNNLHYRLHSIWRPLRWVYSYRHHDLSFSASASKINLYCLATEDYSYCTGRVYSIMANISNFYTDAMENCFI